MTVAVASRHTPPRQQGYILLFVLGVLLILGMLSLSVAFRQRLGFALVNHAKDSTQLGLVLRGAAEYTGAQLIKASVLEGLVQAKDGAVNDITLWQPGGQPYEILINDNWVSVHLYERVAVPNINLFDEKELQRLFVALGANAADASKYAQALLKAKPKDGFASPEALRDIADIPAFYLLGGNAAESASLQKNAAGASTGAAPITTATTADPASKSSAATDGTAPDDAAAETRIRPGLIDMVGISGSSKKIDLNQTALEVIAALANLPIGKLVKLADLRAQGYVKRDQAIEAIGPELGALIGTPDSYRAILTVADRPRWAEAIYQQQGRWRIKSFEEHLDSQPPIPSAPVAASESKQELL